MFPLERDFPGFSGRMKPEADIAGLIEERLFDETTEGAARRTQSAAPGCPLYRRTRTVRQPASTTT